MIRDGNTRGEPMLIRTRSVMSLLHGPMTRTALERALRVVPAGRAIVASLRVRRPSRPSAAHATIGPVRRAV